MTPPSGSGSGQGASVGDASPQLVTLERSGAVHYASAGGIWVMTLFAPPVKADMMLARPALQKMASAQPGGFATLTWVLPEAGYRMDQDARQAASDVTKQFDGSIRVQATLIEGAGFQGAAVRAIIAGLDAVARSTSKKRVFSELGPAITWCLTEVPQRPSPSASELTHALAQLSASLRA